MPTGNGKDVLTALIHLLKLEKIKENQFTGPSQDLGFGNLFGGQILGQALSAATQTVDPEFCSHSLHGYFLRPGNTADPITYMVDPIRDGKGFVTRRVKATQKGRAIFSMGASFHKKETGFSHYPAMPEVPGPDGVESEAQMAQRLSKEIPPDILEKLIRPKPIEIRVLNPVNPFCPTVQPPEKYIWFRAAGNPGKDPALHQCLMAYASDFHLVSTALRPHGKTFWSRDMQVASLDHALWFHREFTMDKWFLYATKSPAAGNGRGLNFGSIYTREGELVASVAQEGLMRSLPGQ